MGLLQIRQILCKLILHFEMELLEECTEWSNQKARLLWEMPPLMIRLKHRMA